MLVLNLITQAGTLTMTDASGKSIAGSGTHAITVNGTLAKINADLAHLSYVVGSGAGNDTITVDVWDQAGVEGTKTIAVNVAASLSGPSIALPAMARVDAGATMTIGGIVITDAYAAGNPGSMVLNLNVTSGTLTMVDAATATRSRPARGTTGFG